jgi:transposase
MNDAEQPCLLEIASYVREHGVSAAANHFNLSDSTVRRRAQKAGLHFQVGRPRNRDKARRNVELLQLRRDGMSLSKIGAVYSIMPERVRQILEDLGGDPLKKLKVPASSAARQMA